MKLETMKFYVTTPIYYVNDVPHIGHAYTTISADIIARFKRMCGYKVFFLTGTDEHGKKIEKAAQEKGVTPKELADTTHQRFKELWKRLNISYDKFIRTTDQEHQEAVKYFWLKIKKNIYKSKYKGWYCIPCETFVPSSQIGEQETCPTCGRKLEFLEEESYFLSTSEHKENLRRYIKEHDVIKPDFRRNEILNAIDDLQDISISRPSSRVSWGVRVPDDESQTIYVWFDALINYISAIGYPKPMEFWPADIHIVGKDILKFHSIIWPIMLMSAGLELPKKIFAHGWWKVKGQKMSKSLKNVVDPFELSKVFKEDTVRFFLFREIPFGNDGDFSDELILKRYENDLAKDIGNLFLRVSKFSETNFPDGVRKSGNLNFAEINLSNILDDWIKSMSELDFYSALNLMFQVVSYANRYMDIKAPWKSLKIGNREEAQKIIYDLCYLIKVILYMLYPFCPSTSTEVSEKFGIKIEKSKSEEDLKKDILVGYEIFKVSSTGVLFPKIEG
ncbi:MAG: methionine--tRNA ligase [Candidatus Calescibacterium sp.]|nr:methionine--tRNA ligase [Candidatus Calescibacterium sp.]MCX7734116.1 methionine--tRNA ligase [bacterium]